jgi:hypothetical protein
LPDTQPANKNEEENHSPRKEIRLMPTTILNEEIPVSNWKFNGTATFARLAFLIACIAFVFSFLSWQNTTELKNNVLAIKQSIVKTKTAEMPIVRVNRTEPAPQVPSLKGKLQKGLVGRGGGYETPLIRQLENDPSLADSKQVNGTKIEFKGNRSDTKALHRWAVTTVQLIAKATGHVDGKYGAEIRVKDPSTAFLFQKSSDGKLYVAEYTNATSNNPQLQTTREVLSGHVPPNHFLGWPSAHHPLPAYEYLNT